MRYLANELGMTGAVSRRRVLAPLIAPSEHAKARVARSIARLDAFRKSWRLRVDFEVLDLSSAENCVLGQIYGSYAFGVAHLAIGGRLEEHDYGFVARSPEELADLLAAWRATLTDPVIIANRV